ncbi:MAG TPA: AMP nucleosidase, partial [Castellaniella sp.]|nr:AMP nucleosidase [Castellaniella sp.]
MPPLIPFSSFHEAEAALEQLRAIYTRNTLFIREAFREYCAGTLPEGQRVRACYPAIRIRVNSYQEVDSRLSYGHLVEPGVYMITVTQPGLFCGYLNEQIGLLIRNHRVPVEIGESDIPIPLHFTFPEGEYVESEFTESPGHTLRDHFDVPDLAVTDDAIVNGTWQGRPGQPRPLGPFTAPRVDYSLYRLQHYTATAPQHFQDFVLFTNYQFYVDEFIQWARDTLVRGEGDYTELVEPGNRIVTPETAGDPYAPPTRLPQMPSYHLKREGHSGITLINIGVGPSNA